MATDPRAPRPPVASQRSTANGQRRSRFRERNLVLNPCPVIAASLGAFLLTLTLLTAGFVAGQHPGVGVGALVGQVAGSGGDAPLTTRASGAPTRPSGASSGLTGAPTGPSGTPRAQPGTSPLVTSTSGGATARGSVVGGDEGA